MLKAKLQNFLRRFLPFVGIELNRSAGMQSMLRQELEAIRQKVKQLTPTNPALKGYKCYSQFDEDGIIAHLTDTLQIERGCFVEFGSGNGLENNSHLLLLKGWRGLWVDGDPVNGSFIRSNLPLHTTRLAYDSTFITIKNIRGVIEKGLKHVASQNIDLYSMDLDGNDVYFTDEVLKYWRPKIVICEYNGKIPFGLRLSVEYDENSKREEDDYFGASLSEHIARLKGYRLVCCGLSGVNAFFVRDDLADKFITYDPVHLYQPARVHLTFMAVGSRPSLKFLAQTLRS